MQWPKTSLYTFDRLLSENGACSTWVAKPVGSDRLVVVKVVRGEQSPESKIGRKVLLESYGLQASIRAPWVVRAVQRVTEGDQVFIEYPHLDPAVWRELTPELVVANLPAYLAAIAQTVDYLHLLGLVHGDLKISNFLTDGAPVPRVRLIDLDFLCAVNSPPEARVFGTPDHIAPEVLANDCIVAQSDNYSLGVELRLLVERHRDLFDGGSDAPRRAIEVVEKLAALLTTEDVLQRPRLLVRTLAESGLLTAEERAVREKELLGAVMRTRLVSVGPKERTRPDWFTRYLRHGCHVLGLRDELLDLFSACFATRRLSTWRVWLGLVAESATERHGDYFQISPDDTRLLATYERLQRIADTSAAREVTGGTTFDALFSRARAADDAAQFELAYLLYGRAHRLLSEQPGSAEEKYLTVLRRRAALAESLGRAQEARDHYAALIAYDAARGPEWVRAVIQCCYLTNGAGYLNEAESLMRSAEPVAQQLTDRSTGLAFRRMQAWLKIGGRNFTDAERVLEETLAESRRDGDLQGMLAGEYALGVLHWHRGEFQTARRVMESAVALPGAERYINESSSLLVGLSMLCSEMAEYGPSIRYAKRAGALLTDQKKPLPLATTWHSIVFAYVRMADQAKAEHWLHRMLEIFLATGDHFQKLRYYQASAFVKLTFGDLRGAKELLGRALEEVDPLAPPSKLTGKIYHLLIEVALEEGQPDQGLRYADTAEENFAKCQDETSLHEVRLLRLLVRAHLEGGNHLAEICEEVRHLVRLRSHYVAVLGYFHAQLLSADGRPPVEPPDILLAERTETDKVPLFAASRALMSARSHPENGALTPATVKEALRILMAAKNRPLTMLTGLKLAELYRLQNRSRHAHKFLLQAQRLAVSSHNRLMADRVAALLGQEAVTVDSNERLIASFRAMSDILKGIGNYRESLLALIQFAIDQSGAERGVLLLRSGTGDRLYVAASVDCDDQSLTDILDFSHSVPNYVLRQATPLIIENAVEDRRTSHYQSVLTHNILSVLAVPLSYDGEPLGVLYLDHHAIPTLFQAQDIAYIETVANVIAVALATAANFRTLRYANIELRADLVQLGYTGEFRTKDAAMLRLLGEIESIAKTTASVLILGESGTGKEIICDLIHKLSLRTGGNLVKLNCAAIPRDNIETELFGVEDNAFSGVKGRDGKLAAASGGTLYLDEIGDMALEVQAKILRVIEYQQYERVGGTRLLHTDVRFIAATNKNIEAMVRAGSFREDLFHRINTIIIEIPPLRKRPGDITLLIDYFLNIYSSGRVAPIITPEVYRALAAHTWPGNVRELRNLIERFCILFPGQRVTKQQLPAALDRAPGDQGREATENAREHSEAALEARMRDCLRRAGGNVSKAAKFMGMPNTTFRRWMRRLRIRPPW